MKRTLVSALCRLVALALAQNLVAETFSDANWFSLGSGMNNSVAALAVSGKSLYAGGSFTNAGGVAANLVARWNGTSWSALGSGISGASAGYGPAVYALAVSGSNLYVGGAFTNAGGVAASSIAQWNGTSWAALGSGMGGQNPYVLALAVSGSNLYAAGEFTTAGGVSANYIAQWNGTSWSALGSGMSGGDVYALAVSGTNLFAGGYFTNAGGVAANSIAQWNGSSWSALGSGMLGAGGLPPIVLALAVSGTNLYSGGNFTTAGVLSVNFIAQWNGISWSALGPGLNNNVLALAVSGNNLYAGGQFTNAGGVPANYIARWNGVSWSALGSGTGGSNGTPAVSALAASGNNLYAGGNFTTAGGTAANYVAGAFQTFPPVILTANGHFGFTNGGGWFGFDVSASPGETLVVEGSSNFVNWLPLQTNTLSTSLWYFSDPSASNFATRFYRAALLP